MKLALALNPVSNAPAKSEHLVPAGQVGRRVAHLAAKVLKGLQTRGLAHV